MSNTPPVNRRQFVKTTAGLSGGLLLSFMVPAYGGRLKKLLQPTNDAITFAPNAFLRIGNDNSIRILLSHVEMGQGIWTTLTMLIAEELDADWKQIKVEHCPVDKAYNHTAWGMQITGGSSTTWSEFDRYRKAGATARILLIQAAAAKWKVPIEAITTQNGFVKHGNKKFTYGQLAESAAALKPPADIALRPKEQWKYIGKGIKRLDAPDKVNGKAIYGIDIQIPGMHYAAVLHAPVMGSQLLSFDAANAKIITGVTDVVQIPGGVAVIASNTWAAIQGKKAITATWNDGPVASVNSATQMQEFKQLATTPGKQTNKAGDVTAALLQATKTISAHYTLPYLAHAAMEPLNCTVQIINNECTIWTGTQMPGTDQAAAAKILGFKPAQVTVITPFLGGGFGRRATLESDFVVEAVHIAKASGKTIKMVWTREDDTQGGYYRPSFLHSITAGIDASGKPLFWQHTLVGQSLPGDDGSSSTEGIADSPYLKEIPHYSIQLHAPKLGITTLWLRSVGHTHTAFAMESMIDELAHLAGKDAVQYRRMLLANHPRNLRVLNLAADKAGWGKPLPAGHFQGVAVHESFRSYCAQVAEISITADGAIKIHKVTAAIDCGLAVNPDGVRMQIESCINYALSACMYGAITFKNGQVQQSNFNNYRVLRIDESPAVIETHIADSTDPMGGVGEPGFPPTAPAIANAVFAATGIRLRSQPFVQSSLKA
jgi:isoquinoline 1-oxidoreductase subunit beta